MDASIDPGTSIAITGIHSFIKEGSNIAPGNSLNRNGRLFLMHVEEAQEAPDIMLGMFSVNSVLARVLFDSGASH